MIHCHFDDILQRQHRRTHQVKARQNNLHQSERDTCISQPVIGSFINQMHQRPVSGPTTEEPIHDPLSLKWHFPLKCQMRVNPAWTMESDHCGFLWQMRIVTRRRQTRQYPVSALQLPPWVKGTLYITSGSRWPWGPGRPCPQDFVQNQFSGTFKGKNSKLWAQGPPPKVKTPLAPWPKSWICPWPQTRTQSGEPRLKTTHTGHKFWSLVAQKYVTDRLSSSVVHWCYTHWCTCLIITVFPVVLKEWCLWYQLIIAVDIDRKKHPSTQPSMSVTQVIKTNSSASEFVVIYILNSKWRFWSSYISPPE